MKIITQEFEALFKDYPLYTQDGVKNPIVIAKFFVGNITWYLTEYDKETKNAFGYVTGMNEDEFGYIHIPELEEIRVNNIWEVEIDLYFKTTPLKDLIGNF